MLTLQLTDVQIDARIVPTHLRWPESGTSTVWTTAHHCVDALKHLVRRVDLACFEAEEDPEHSASGIARRRAEICDQALRKLLNFAAFETAGRALSENVDALERLPDCDPEQAQMLQKLKQALKDLREGVEATKRLVRERCKVREGVSV